MAFVVRGDRPVVRVDLGAADAIARQVGQWRESFGRKSNDQNPGEGLRKSVWLPLEPHLEAIEIVLVSPDRALAQLPWGALPGAKPGSYLLEERAIAVIPVPQILPALLSKERRAGLPESLLVAGDIDYGGNSGAASSDKRNAAGRLRDGKLFEFTRLPAGPAEMVGIEKRFQPKPGSRAADMLRGSAATEAAFCEQARQHAWLHLITHGYFAPETVRSALAPDEAEEKSFRLLSDSDKPRVVKGEHPGLLSGLAFAGANTPPAPGHDDGILTALEVSSLDLSNVDGVVLSACETGLGEVAGGEGLLGLQRAFQVAGAKTVVASLWKVPDAETSLLMQLFYENVWEKKLPRLEALRQAQLQLLHNYDAQSHTLRGTVAKLKPPVDPAPTDPAHKSAARCPPFFWTAFVLSGDWR